MLAVRSYRAGLESSLEKNTQGLAAKSAEAMILRFHTLQ